MTNIPSQIDGIYLELQREIVWLHARWKIYRQLFGTSEKRINLLNESAASAFYVFQEVLFDEVQIALSKLTDPPRTLTKENLSLEQLQLRIEAEAPSELADTLRSLLDTIHTKCRAFRAHRNRRLAHLDLETAVRSGARPLPPVSRQMIEEALADIRAYMNAVEAHYNDSEMGYEHFAMRGGDGDALIWLLANGLRYGELLRIGRIPFDDQNEGKWRGL
jgi:AbiU2